MGLTETWLCEMMNMPGFTKNGFRPDAVYYGPTPLQDEAEACFLCLDPAFGAEAVNDESAITVHMIQEVGQPIVVDYFKGQVYADVLFEERSEGRRVGAECVRTCRSRGSTCL